MQAGIPVEVARRGELPLLICVGGDSSVLCCGLQVNTFKDGLLKGNDHAGAGLMLTRMAEVRERQIAVAAAVQSGSCLKARLVSLPSQITMSRNSTYH